ncbi:MAG TPA: acyl-CoA dehydrogenase family protein [Dehalococcoidia bacterium]|nr:acyl-CoA dehydrogenase family protein [Dehalococcoidia bacterium]
MDFALTPLQEEIRTNVRAIMSDFGDNYWLDRDRTGDFPVEFTQAMADGGWLGITMPEEYGGAGLGVTDAAILMHTVAKSPGAMSAASAMHINIFGPQPIVVFGNDEQRERFLPALIKGETRVCFGVTEPTAGLDTSSITTRATRDGDDYIISGQKMWTSTAQEADKILLLARTTPRDECERPFDGISLFFADLDRDLVQINKIEKMGRHAVDSNEVFFDDMRVSGADRIGEEGKGFQYLLHSLNPERILVAVEAIGIGQEALDRAANYARERVVFGRPIGQNQSIQHPLAESWAELNAAWLSAMHAAYLYDSGQPCGPEANAAKYLGAEAGKRSCERAILTHGGLGYAKELHVERLFREVLINWIAPVTPQLMLSHIAEKALGLPKSY